MFLLKVFVAMTVVACVLGFSMVTSPKLISFQRAANLKMEYIPDGISKEQWKALKQREAEEQKQKDLGKVGITKFKSRSFEAWQKSGQKHLFPVKPSTPIDERPYMQRKGGSADGEDLKKQGLSGKGQGIFAKKVDADIKYEQLEKEGKLKSTPFSVPWTSSAAEKLAKENALAAKAAKSSTSSKAIPTNGAGKTLPLSPARQQKSQQVASKTKVAVPEEAPKKKGWFSW